MGVGVSGIGSAGVIPLTSALIDGGLAELGKKKLLLLAPAALKAMHENRVLVANYVLIFDERNLDHMDITVQITLWV